MLVSVRLVIAEGIILCIWKFETLFVYSNCLGKFRNTAVTEKPTLGHRLSRKENPFGIISLSYIKSVSLYLFSNLRLI